jgi:hypothetical protein
MVVRVAVVVPRSGVMAQGESSRLIVEVLVTVIALIVAFTALAGLFVFALVWFLRRLRRKL